MPSVSEKQRKLMAAACKDAEFAKKVGISQELACEFYLADSKRDKKQKKRKRK